MDRVSRAPEETVKVPLLLRVFWAAGGLALLLGFAREPLLGLLPAPRELPRADGATGRPWVEGEFYQVPGFQSIAGGALPAGLHQATSWLGTDASQGRAESAWFRANRRQVHVGVAGFPRRAGISLWAEFRDHQGAVSRIDCDLPDTGEVWSVWSLTRPHPAVAVRIVAEDRTSATFGWVAFSHPYRAWPGWITALYLHLQLYTTLALALTLLWGPGLCWFRRTRAPELRPLALLATGPLLLAAVGLTLWGAGRWVAPAVLGPILVPALWLGLGFTLWRRPPTEELGREVSAVLLLTALLTVAGVAKSAYSIGPEGETYRGSISRNLTAGDRLDSRFAFYTVQGIAHHLGPIDPEFERFHHPWTFFSRGPLAGLTAAPIVLATGGRPPADLPEQRWSPFDREGFAAYRVTMIALAGGIVLACGLALAPFLGGPWALAAAGLIALSPFGLHEMVFTWPKWIATAWLVVAFGLIHARRPTLAGAAIGVGFLYHPLVLLWTPWLALWAAGRGERRVAAIAGTWLRFAAGAAIFVGPWMLLGRLVPHLPEALLAGQSNFLRYWQLADSNLGTWSQWWHARWLNFANTFLPHHLWLSDFSYHHFRLNSTHEPSGPLVKFAFLWWNTLPFGAGLGLWALGLVGVVRAWHPHRAALLLLLAGPALVLVLYWGMDPLGLMRESGHPLLVAFVALACAGAAHGGGRLARWLAHRAFPWLQLPETLLMLWLTTLLNPRPWAVLHPELDGAALAINLLALGGAAWLLARHRAVLRPVPAAQNNDSDRFARLLPVALTLAVALGCYAATVPGRALIPAFPELAAHTEGTFPRDGQYQGEPLERAAEVRLWGSWSGSDENTGTLTLGPFPAPAVLRLALGGYFSVAGNQLALERPDTGARHLLPVAADIGERWRVHDFSVPAGWVGQPVRLVARDQARAMGGWLAISEPLHGGRGKGSVSFPESLAAWLVNGLLYFFPWMLALGELHRRRWLPPAWRPLGAAAAVALLGYLAFWAYWVHPVLGHLCSGGALGGAVLLWWRRPAGPPAPDPDSLAGARLLGLVGLFSLAWLHLFPATTDYHTLAARRFRPMPGDNTLPHNTAVDLHAGRPLRQPGTDWLSSDRPPLQAGWLLLARPVTSALGLDDRTASGTAALWCEGLWVFAAFGLLRTLGLRRPRALAWTALLAFTGFFLLNTIFTWPKLSAAAFVTSAVVLVLTSAGRPPERPVVLAAGLCAGLAWLAHGGVAFSLLGAAPLLASAGLRFWRRWLPAAASFALLVVPWFAYQKFYDPPGDRLLKWHLAGQVEKDPRGIWRTLRENYGTLTAGQIVENKVRNLQFQVGGDWRASLEGSRAGVKGRREDEFFHTGRALTWWVLGFLALPFALARARAAPWRRHAALALWALATLLVWCLLMFSGGSAMVHQGSYAVLLVLFALLAAWAELASPWTLAALALLQGFTFATTWVTGTTQSGSAPDAVAATVAGLAFLALVSLVVREHRAAAAEER